MQSRRYAAMGVIHPIEILGREYRFDPIPPPKHSQTTSKSKTATKILRSLFRAPTKPGVTPKRRSGFMYKGTYNRPI